MLEPMIKLFCLHLTVDNLTRKNHMAACVQWKYFKHMKMCVWLCTVKSMDFAYFTLHNFLLSLPTWHLSVSNVHAADDLTSKRSTELLSIKVQACLARPKCWVNWKEKWDKKKEKFQHHVCPLICLLWKQQVINNLLQIVKMQQKHHWMNTN